MKKNKTRILAIPFALTALLLASCSDDNKSSSTTAKPAATSTTSVEEVAEASEDSYSTEDSTYYEEDPAAEDPAIEDPILLLAASVDSNPLTGGDISTEEAECIVNNVMEADPVLFEALVEMEMNGVDIEENEDMSAKDAMTVLEASVDCTRDSSIAAAMAEYPELDAMQAECLFDEMYGPESMTMMLVDMAAEMEAEGVSEDDPEFMAEALEMMVMMASEPTRIAEECGVDETIVSTIMEGEDVVYDEDDALYDDDAIIGYEDEGMEYDDTEEISAADVLCLLEGLEDYPEMRDALLTEGDNYEPENTEDLMKLLEVSVACGIDDLN